MRKRQYFRKSYKIQRKKSIFKYRSFWLTILILVVGSGIFYLISFFSFFQIKEIEIRGNQKIFIEDIQKIIQNEINQKILSFPTRSIFLADLTKIDKILSEEFPQIANLELERNFPNALTVIIKERKSVAIFYQKERQFVIDKEGVFFKKVTELKYEQRYLKIKKAENLILDKELKLGEKVLKRELLTKILKIEKQLLYKEDILITEALVVSDERLNVKTSENWEIYFNLRDGISDQIFNLSLVLDEKIPIEKRKDLEYIDLRFGSRVFFRYLD